MSETQASPDAAPAPPGGRNVVLPAEDATQSDLVLSYTPGAQPTSPVWVFLHGLGSDRNGDKALRFRDWLSERGPGFAALDFTGHGDSGGDCRGLSLTRNLEDMDRTVSFLTNEVPGAPLSFIGSSMGGIAALWYAALHPGAVAQLFAIAPAFRMAARLAASLSTAEREGWAERGYLPFPLGDRVLEFGWDGVADEERYPTDRLVEELTTPALLLHGDEDAVVPVELSRDFAEACPVAEIAEIEGGDHRLGEHKDLLFELMWDAAQAEARRLASPAG